MWVRKPHIAGIPRYRRWVGSVKVSRLSSGPALNLKKRSEYEVLVSSIQDIHVKVAMEGVIEPQVEPQVEERQVNSHLCTCMSLFC